MTSLAVLLLLGSLFVCTFWFADRWEDLFKEHIEFLAECRTDLDNAAAEMLANQLTNLPGIQNLRYVPAADALAVMRKELGSLALPDTMANPFAASFRFNLRADLVDEANVKALRNVILALDGVDNLYYPEDLYAALRNRLRTIALVTGAIGGLLVLLILVMIHHQIRMYIMQHRYHIRTMSLVGATRAYIRKPFIAEVMKMSSFSILVAAIGFLLLLLWVSHVADYPIFDYGLDMIVTGLLFIVTLGTLMSFGAAWSAIQRYLESTDARDFI